jgi:hypothetical protein
VIESLPLAVTRVTTNYGNSVLTHATGFFFERDGRLFLITSRHVLLDAPSGHHPDRVEIELHVDAANVARTAMFSIPLYADGQSLWREGSDSAGAIDVAALALDRDALPPGMLFHAFRPEQLLSSLDLVELGAPLLIVGFPLGVHDDLHHLPVARQAVVASAFGIRFQGRGCFLTDARLHRGTSGAPVVARSAGPGDGRSDFPWTLLGVHTASLDLAWRDASQDESLGLNFAWYADILLALT